MNIKRLLLGTLAVGGGLALARKLFMTNASARAVGDNASFEAIDAFVEEERNRLKIPGVSLAIVEGDRIVHLRGFGQARPGGKVPTPQTPFFIASLTKSFTALAVMQLVEAGMIDLDAPVRRYLPWFRVADPQASVEITVRHLLNQTSGLPTSSGEFPLADFDNHPDAAERQGRALSTLALTRPVGAAFEYSNANYNVLGLIIEAASGERYSDYIREHIFTPLGMTHSTTSPEVAKRNGLAVGHQYWFAWPLAAPDMPFPSGSLAGGGIIATAEDMAHFLIAHLNGGRYGEAQLLSSDGFDTLHRGVAEFRTMGISVGEYGMGWFERRIGQTKLVWHTGILPHFFAHMALLPEQGRGMALLLNASGHWMSPVLTDFGTGVAALLADDRPSPSRFGFIPLALRGLLLVPVLQLSGTVVTLWRLRRWRLYPESRPSRGRIWGQHVLLPLISNLLAALSLKPTLGERRGYLKLYMPDYSLIAIVCGSFSLVWGFLRTALVLRALRGNPPS
jgi:CubicO group peptidase (beta-lactamase class C family)